MRRAYRAGLLLIAASALSYGLVAPTAKLALGDGLDVLPLLFLRYALGAAALVALAFATRADAPRRDLAIAFTLGAAGYAGTSLLYFLSLPHVPAAVASFLLFTSPVLVALLARALFAERLGARGSAALLLSAGGVALLTLAAGAGDVRARGVAFALAAAVAYAGTIVAARRVVADLPAVPLAAAVLSGAAVSYAVAGVATGSLALPPTPRAWVAVVVLAWVATSVSVATFFAGLPLVGASRAAIVSTLEPASTVLFSAALLGERLSAAQLAGGGLVVAAATILAWAPAGAAAERGEAAGSP